MDETLYVDSCLAASGDVEDIEEMNEVTSPGYGRRGRGKKRIVGLYPFWLLGPYKLGGRASPVVGWMEGKQGSGTKFPEIDKWDPTSVIRYEFAGGTRPGSETERDRERDQQASSIPPHDDEQHHSFPQPKSLPRVEWSRRCQAAKAKGIGATFGTCV